MSNHSVIKTDRAPAAIGTYSQAIKAGTTVYLSGQIRWIRPPWSWWTVTWKRRSAACSTT